MNTLAESVACFCNLRCALSLAQVSAGWRRAPEIARVCRVFRESRADCIEPEIIADIGRNAGRVLVFTRGYLDVRTASFDDLIIRIVSWFAREGLRDVACDIMRECEGVLQTQCEIVLKFAQFLANDCEVFSTFEDHSYAPCAYENSVTCAQILSMHGKLCDDARERMKSEGDLAYSFGYCLMENTIRSIMTSVGHTEVTEFLENIACGNIDAVREFLFFACPILSMTGIAGIVKKVFTDIKVARAMRCRIGPKFARFIQRSGCVYHIAAQFAYDTPEFGRYVVMLDRLLAKPVRSVHKMRAILDLQLAASARNPDERAFDYVYDRLRREGLIDRKCEVMWNCGGGFEELQRAVTRLESRGIVATFDRDEFWARMRINALAPDEAKQCMQLILARFSRIPPRAHMIECLMFCARCYGYAVAI